MDKNRLKERFDPYKGFYDQPEQVIQGYEQMSQLEQEAIAGLLRREPLTLSSSLPLMYSLRHRTQEALQKGSRGTL